MKSVIAPNVGRKCSDSDVDQQVALDDGSFKGCYCTACEVKLPLHSLERK